MSHWLKKDKSQLNPAEIYSTSMRLFHEYEVTLGAGNANRLLFSTAVNLGVSWNTKACDNLSRF